MSFVLDILKQTASLLIGIGALTAVAFVLREWIKRLLDHYFKLSEAKTALANQVELEFLRSKVPMVIELTQIIYKARNYARQILQEHTPLVQEKDCFAQCSSILTERLYAYRVLLDEEAFIPLHEFKRASQDFLTYLDISDRPENLRDGKLYFSDVTETRLTDLFNKMEYLYSDILLHFQGRYGLEKTTRS